MYYAWDGCQSEGIAYLWVSEAYIYELGPQPNLSGIWH